MSLKNTAGYRQEIPDTKLVSSSGVGLKTTIRLVRILKKWEFRLRQNWVQVFCLKKHNPFKVVK